MVAADIAMSLFKRMSHTPFGVPGLIIPSGAPESNPHDVERPLRPHWVLNRFGKAGQAHAWHWSFYILLVTFMGISPGGARESSPWREPWEQTRTARSPGGAKETFHGESTIAGHEGPSYAPTGLARLWAGPTGLTPGLFSSAPNGASNRARTRLARREELGIKAQTRVENVETPGPSFARIGRLKPNAAYFLPKLRILPKLWGGPPGPRGSPWTRFSPMKSASSTLRRADGGVGCGPGVRPTINADCAVLGKVCGIRRKRLPHQARAHRLVHWQ